MNNQLKKMINVMFISLIILTLSYIIFFIAQSYISNRTEMISQAERELLNIQRDVYDKLEFIYKFREIINTEFEFLDFITSENEKSGKDYYNFRKNILNNMDNILAINNFNNNFKIIVNNQTLLNMPPLIYKSEKILGEELTIMHSSGVYNLYCISHIKYRKKTVTMEFIVPLNQIIKKRNSKAFFTPYNEKNKGIYTLGNNLILQNPNIQLRLSYPLDKNKLYNQFLTYGIALFMVSALFLTILFYLSYKVLKPQFTDMSILLDSVGLIKSGELNGSFKSLSKGSYFKKYSIQLQETADSIRMLIDKAVTAEQKALQAQINSHFLANSLEVVKMKALIKKDYDISDNLTDLGHMLRYAIELDRQFVTVDEELEYTERFIHLYSMKRMRKIDLIVEIDKELRFIEIPKLIIEPFVENAVEHGIVPAIGEGVIKINIDGRVDSINIKISDNGVGLGHCKVDDDGFPVKGIGISNIRKRLEKHYGDNSKLSIVWSDQGTEVHIYLGSLLNA